MKCPYCDNEDSKVIDSRHTEDGRAIRRRRECESCGRRFTTYEKVEEMILMVVKKDGSRQAFDRNKLLNGIVRACEKRPVSVSDMEGIVNDIERGLNNMMEKEVESSFKRGNPVFFEGLALSLEEIFISETEVVGYDIRKFVLG